MCSCVIASFIIHEMVWKNKLMSIEEICQVANEYDSECVKWVNTAYESNEIENLKLDDEPTMAYTYRTLSAALWAYFHAPDILTGLLAIVNEGGDADTNAAIACAILGAKFGYSSIPSYYVENLHNRDVYHQKVISFINQVADENA